MKRIDFTDEVSAKVIEDGEFRTEVFDITHNYDDGTKNDQYAKVITEYKSKVADAHYPRRLIANEALLSEIIIHQKELLEKRCSENS